jgi:hypothetical protein
MKDGEWMKGPEWKRRKMGKKKGRTNGGGETEKSV